MNNRYVYRAKDRDKGKWVVGSLVVFSDEYMTIKVNNNRVGLGANSVYEFNRDTLGQCTGMTVGGSIRHTGYLDKVAFEGDILRSGNEKYIIVWLDWAAGFGIKDVDSEYVEPLCMIPSLLHMEIIGNIHDNPALLNAQEGA